MTTQARLRAEADGAAIASLISAFFIPLLAIILGHVSRGQAKRRGLQPSAVATWGTVLGYVFTGLSALVVIVLLVTAAKVGSDLNNVAPSATPSF